MQLNVFNQYTYTLETIIRRPKRDGYHLCPARTNGVLRSSRLVRVFLPMCYVPILTILRIFMVYKPLRFFLFLGSVPFSMGVTLGIRWLIYFFAGTERTRIPSLILATILILMGFQLWILGLVADLLAANRKLMEEIQLRLRRRDFRE